MRFPSKLLIPFMHEAPKKTAPLLVAKKLGRSLGLLGQTNNKTRGTPLGVHKCTKMIETAQFVYRN